MKIIKSSALAEINMEPLVLALGSFDGLHFGHQAVIKKTKEIAKRLKLPSGVYTFAPHPLKVIEPAFAPTSLISPRQKIEILSEQGVDYYFEQKFTLEFAQYDYRSFVQDILVDRLNVAHLVIGEDFRFGHKTEGDFKLLQELGKEFGFSVSSLETINIGSKKISSTRIREMIKNGDISSIPSLLGRYYRLDGKVIHGEGRGHQLGIPTANLKLATDYVLPPRGVYAGYVYCQGKKYKGIANFGIKPTFSGHNYTIEIYILDLDEDLYGKRLSFELVEFLRKEITFTSSDKLLNQIKKDILYIDSLVCYNY